MRGFLILVLIGAFVALFLSATGAGFGFAAGGGDVEVNMFNTEAHSITGEAVAIRGNDNAVASDTAVSITGNNNQVSRGNGRTISTPNDSWVWLVFFIGIVFVLIMSVAGWNSNEDGDDLWDEYQGNI